MKIALEVSGVMPFLLGISVGLGATIVWLKMTNPSEQKSDTDNNQTAMESVDDANVQEIDSIKKTPKMNGHSGARKKSVSSTSQKVETEKMEKNEENEKKV